MFKSYWKMIGDPFSGPLPRWRFESQDYKLATGKLKHAVDTRGIVLFTGTAGAGKTFAARQYLSSLSRSAYKVSYIPASTLSTTEFYKAIASSLGVEPSGRKFALFAKIKSSLASLAETGAVPIICLDECHHLCQAVLSDLVMLLNFEMDSQRVAPTILIGHPNLADTLSLRIHDSLRQRITVSYKFQGLTRDETAQYVCQAMAEAKAASSVFEPAALAALHEAGRGCVRQINSLATRCLLIGFQKRLDSVGAEEVAEACEDYAIK
jgi:type II secretory pathway predicted ATPase ExeA